MAGAHFPGRWGAGIGLLGTLFAAAAIASPPADPFDYSYCGGKPVYPVVGLNFATSCGPRNQIALGQRGQLMWSFPSRDGRRVYRQGVRTLSPEELGRLSLLAELARFADPPPPASGGVVYVLGIDITGHVPKRVRTSLAAAYSPAGELARALLALVPDEPLLPECPEAVADFDPTQLPPRQALAAPPREYP